VIVLTAVVQAFLTVVLVACVLVAVAIARDVLTTPYAELRCMCGPGIHHPSCPTRLAAHA
jgi:hypothetical protein